MMTFLRSTLAFTLLLAPFAHSGEPLTTATVMEALEEADWRKPDPSDLLYIRLPEGEVIIELAPAFAPTVIANIKTLVSERYFDGLAVIRSQDNYVVQWGDPAEDEDARPLGSAARSVKPEYFRSAEGLNLVTVESRDAYADIVGFANGFPVASNGDEVWLTHCYGMVGVARGAATDSGTGSSLYTITGHAPRHLDRNIALVGRIIHGIEHLSALPRGTGALGFYEIAGERTPIISVRTGDELAADERRDIKILRTDTQAFKDYVQSRTFRHDEWFVEPTGRIEICNLIPPVSVN